MSSFFDKALHHLGRTKEEVIALNIGAMDGVMFDEMIGYSNMYSYKVLYVEPIPYLYARLKTNITDSNAKFENCAISDYNGTISMMVIDQDVIDKGIIHPCFYGMSAVYPPRNGLGSEFDRETVEKYGRTVEVPCKTLQTVLDAHNIGAYDIMKVDAEGHDYQIFKQIDFANYRPKVIRIEWINLTEEEKNLVIGLLKDHEYRYEIADQDLCAITKELYDELYKPSNVTTIVTGIWDIKRQELTDDWSRPFQHYLTNLERLLQADNNVIIYIQKEYEEWVWKHRDPRNTAVIVKELEWFRSNGDIFEKIQKIRKDPAWYSQADWLKHSTQAQLEYYNPIVMSKMFLLNDAAILDPFNSTHLVWIDGGLTNTVHSGYFWHDKVIDKIGKYLSKFSFVAFPYDGKVEIHGFKYGEMCRYAGAEVDKVCRGGIFGGPKHSIAKINELYYSTLVDSLNEGLMGTEESLFTILLYKYPEYLQYYSINSDGLLGTFFEDLKNDRLQPKIQSEKIKVNPHNIENTALYVITYNSPRQFQELCKSFINYDPDFINKPSKYLLNNSIDRTTDEDYISLCLQYGFEHIKKDNIGICGGRQFIAEHAEENKFDYYFFFEDDMTFYSGEDAVCKNGFIRKIPSLYSKALEIAWLENFDYLKCNFTEFYGDNTKQWAWHNVPAEVREQLFPEKPRKYGNDQDQAPYLKYNNIKSHKKVAYATGEVYYCNWPQVVSRLGNRKMFLDTKWAHPYEQTWMSYIYQKTLNKEIYTGILLASPTEHNRFDHYTPSERREN